MRKKITTGARKKPVNELRDDGLSESWDPGSDEDEASIVA